MHDASLTLRAAKQEEAERLLAFYEANRDRFLLPRPFEEFTRSIKHGQFFVVVDDENEIVAASGVFDYGEDPPFVELAETFVAPSVRGFGIQRVFFKLRIASVLLFQGPEVGITTAIDGSNRRSLTTALGQGFESWASPIKEAFASCPSCPHMSVERRCCCDFYLLPAAKAKEAISGILAESALGSIALQGSSGKAIALTCECGILKGEQRLALQEFVAGSSW